MSGVETLISGIRPEFRTGNLNTPVKPQQDGNGARVDRSDQVELKNFFGSLSVEMLQRVDSAITVQRGGEGSFGQIVAESSSMRYIRMSFEKSQPPAGTMAEKLAAYADQKGGDTFASQRAGEAENIVNAHIAAIDGNPFGPEATASRIVDFALGFFPMFAADNPDMTYEEQVDAFKKMVEGAIDNGFKEAMAILGNLPSQVSDGIKETKSLIQGKLDAFFSHLKGDGADEGKKAADEGGWAEYVKNFFGSQVPAGTGVN